MNMMQISVQSLPLELINYLISKIHKHESRYPWMLEQDGFRKWQRSEHAFGNPIPNYCGDSYTESLRIIEKFRPYIEPTRRPSIHGTWRAYDPMSGDGQDGNTIIEACMRCYVASVLGKQVDLPESLINEMCPGYV